MLIILLLRTQDGKPKETGFFLKELGAPLIKVLQAGYDVQVEQQDSAPTVCLESLHVSTVLGLQHSAALLGSVCSTQLLTQFANPNGKAPNMDPLSDNKIWFMPSLSEKDSEKELLERMGVEKNFKSPTKFSDISDSQLQSYAGILIPGGEHMTALLNAFAPCNQCTHAQEHNVACVAWTVTLHAVPLRVGTANVLLSMAQTDTKCRL